MRRPSVSLRRPAAWGPPAPKPATTAAARQLPASIEGDSALPTPDPRRADTTAPALRCCCLVPGPPRSSCRRGLSLTRSQGLRRRSCQRGEPSPQRLPAVSRVCNGASGSATPSLRQRAEREEDGEAQKEEGWLPAWRRSKGGCGHGEGAGVAAGTVEEQAWSWA